jgi:uncharacterized protein YkwD
MKFLRQGLVLSLALIAPVVWAQSARSSQVESSHAIQAEAWQLLQLANQARAQAGAAPLRWDAALATAARQHCLRMAADRSISHQYVGEPDVSERAKEAGAHFSLVEENVAVGPDPATIHNAWMHSPHHRSNMLNPAVDHIGVAVVASGRTLYAVADFERAVAMLTQEQVEGAIAALLQSSGVGVLRDKALARAACAMDDGMPYAATGPQPRFLMRWLNADLTQLPQALVEKLATGKYHQAAVGSCSPESQEGAFTAYRMAVLLY